MIQGNVNTKLNHTILNGTLKEESIFIRVNDEDRLHLKRFYSQEAARPVFMLHGSIENGGIFYSKSHKGLAPFLARNGFDVFVADVRGHGLSKPSVNRNSTYGLSEIIAEDIPAFYEKIVEIKGEIPQHWIAHSFGGVLMLGSIARFGSKFNIQSLTCFGTRRHLTVKNFSRYYQVDFLYRFFLSLWAQARGFVDVKTFGLGPDNESRKTQQQIRRWILSKHWADEDGFNFIQHLHQQRQPRTLFMTGAEDKALGHPKDVLLFKEECNNPRSEMLVISKANGFLHDYDHINLLTHPDAVNDHFQFLLNWIQKGS